MIPSPEQPQRNLREQAQESMLGVFGNIGLKKYIPPLSGQPKIALLGAGLAVEGKPLSDYFTASGLLKPKIVAFDIDANRKLLVEKTEKRSGIDLDYCIADITNPSSFGNEKYDLVVIRRPAVHTSQSVWEQALRNGIDNLNPNGIMLITASEPGEIEFVRQHLKPKEILFEYNIPEENNVLMLFDEYKLFIAQPKAA